MLIFSNIVGTYYKGPKAVALLSSLEEGTELYLERENDNEYDNNAVKVIYVDDKLEEVTLGYIPKTDNKPIAESLDNGSDFRVELLEGNRIKITDMQETVQAPSTASIYDPISVSDVIDLFNLNS